MVPPSGEGGVQETLILVGPSWTAVTPLGGEAAVWWKSMHDCDSLVCQAVPDRVMLAESEDGLLLDTVQVYSPPVVTVRVCVYCAVSGSSNSVSVPPVTVMESLVQVTVVAGPPVEIQVRVIWSESNVTSPDIVMVPVLIQF